MGRYVSAYCFHDLPNLEAAEESASRGQPTIFRSALTLVRTCGWQYGIANTKPCCHKSPGLTCKVCCMCLILTLISKLGDGRCEPDVEVPRPRHNGSSSIACLLKVAVCRAWICYIPSRLMSSCAAASTVPCTEQAWTVLLPLWAHIIGWAVSAPFSPPSSSPAVKVRVGGTAQRGGHACMH